MNFKRLLLIALILMCFVSVASVSAQDSPTDMVSETYDIDEVYSTANDSKIALDIEDTVYFNASATVDGDGSRNNPFKYVYSHRIPYGSTVYFADGIYNINETCDLMSNSETTQVIFYGESTDGTILKSSANTTAFSVLDNSRAYIYNMTFDSAVIQNKGTLEATNVVFKNGQGVNANPSYPEYNNYFGGAIYSPGSTYYAGYGMPSYLTLNNCTFINNTAVYGGAVYHKNGVTTIRNTKFYSSTAQLYGGALATDAGKITIENSIFEDSNALGDAGGAIYSKATNLTVKNTSFVNGRADFGGAICNLNSQFIVNNCNFTNFTSRYEGGSIYDMYGSVLLENVNIRDTLSDLDGGAIFLDNCTSADLNNVRIDNSDALRNGKAIFSNANNLTMSNVEITNSGDEFALIHQQDKYSYDIDYNSNYTMMMYNSSYDGVLPSRYSLVEDGYVTAVRDQQAGGNCWAFAGIAALESCILKATGIEYDLSEENVKNLVELYSPYGWKYDTNDGGHSEMTFGHLVSWLGPVSESEDKYDDYSTLSPTLNALMHVQNVYYLPARSSTSDNDLMKKAILDYGAVSVGIYWEDSPLAWNSDKNAYYHAVPVNYSNHAVAIVGWDDNYPKENFPLGDMADGDGAWIVKNSWGSDWGDNGYFYVSYSDPVMYRINEDNNAYTFILNDTVRYNRNYQYDVGGMTDYLILHEKSIYYKNTFTSIGNDILTAFSTYFEQNCHYEASLFINDELKLTQNGESVCGYYTIPFDEEFLLNIGDNFTIMIKIDVDDLASLPIHEIVTASRLTYMPNISFFSYDGKQWIDLYDFKHEDDVLEHRYESQVACIKAFTRSSGINSSSIVIRNVAGEINSPVTISAAVYNQNHEPVRNGSVEFEIDGKNYTRDIKNGLANLTLTFSRSGVYNITARFSAEEFPSSNATSKITINKIAHSLSLLINDSYVGDSIKIIIESSHPVNGTVILNINDDNYTLNLTDGKILSDVDVRLQACEYNASVKYNGSNIYLNATNSTSFKIMKRDLKITVVAEEMLKGTDAEIKILLEEDATGEITVLIGEKSYNRSLVNGTAIFNISDLTPGNYTIDVSYSGDDKYNPASERGSVEIIESEFILKADDLTKYYGSAQRFIIELKDFNSTPIANENISVSINGREYTRVTDNSGFASMAINLKSGTYDIITSYREKRITSKVTVLETVEGKDIVKLFRNSTQYYATFRNSNGTLMANKNVSFNINGVYYTRSTNENGTARLNINLAQGEYVITAINPENGEMSSNNITVLPVIIENTNLTKYYRNGSQYSVKVIDAGGNALANAAVRFNINGMIYERTSDEDGIAVININLQEGNYLITAEYNGCRVANSIRVLPVLSAENLVKTRSQTNPFECRVVDGKGNALADTDVTFNINGVFYTRTSNSDGIASLNINLQKGSYIITSSYNNSNIANVVTVID